MSNAIITDDKSLIYRYGKQSHPDPRTNKASTPQVCPYCGEKKYPVHRGPHVFYVGCKCHTARPYSKKFIKG